MNTEIKNYLNDLRLGEVRSHRHITVIPLLAARNGAPPYIALAQAMDHWREVGNDVMAAS